MHVGSCTIVTCSACQKWCRHTRLQCLYWRVICVLLYTCIVDCPVQFQSFSTTMIYVMWAIALQINPWPFEAIIIYILLSMSNLNGILLSITSTLIKIIKYRSINRKQVINVLKYLFIPAFYHDIDTQCHRVGQSCLFISILITKALVFCNGWTE